MSSFLWDVMCFWDEERSCRGGCHLGELETVMCVNMGWDGLDVNWKCEADMGEGIAFDQLEVICEGYDYPEDPYVTAGSCGLEYSLKGTSNAELRSRRPRPPEPETAFTASSEVPPRKERPPSSSRKSSRGTDRSGRGGFGIWTYVVFGIFIFWLLTKILGRGERRPRSRDQAGRGGHGGGGGWNGGNDGPSFRGAPGGPGPSQPPPSHEQVEGEGEWPHGPEGSQREGEGGGTFSSRGTSSTAPTSSSSRSGPGFWAGAVGGAAAGYAAGRLHSSRIRRSEEEEEARRRGWTGSSFSGGSFFRSGDRDAGMRQRRTEEDREHQDASNSSSEPVGMWFAM